MPDTYRHVHIATNGITLHAVEAGPQTGPLLVFLHGFPEFWYGWRAQIEFFAARGYRVVAPDQRGYNLSDKPRGVAAYDLDCLAADVIGIFDHYRADRARLVGHDWGALCAWWVALKFPQRLEKLAILNVPHPAVMRQHLISNRAQRKRSWYVFFFQLPRIPEWRMRKNNWEINRVALSKTSRPGTFSAADLEKYVAAWSRPGAATGMINWYRAGMRKLFAGIADRRIAVPTLLIWGAQDKFMGREMAQPSIDWCDHGRLEFIENATHWVQHEEADRVNELLYGFLQSKRPGAGD